MTLNDNHVCTAKIVHSSLNARPDLLSSPQLLLEGPSRKEHVGQSNSFFSLWLGTPWQEDSLFIYKQTEFHFLALLDRLLQ